MQEPGGLQVVTPSRLHFGLLSFGHADQRQFGGVGVMVTRPGLELAFEPASRFEVSGDLAERVQVAARHWQIFYQRDQLPACSIRVARAPRPHTGLGVGTQLALATAAGLHAWSHEPLPSAAQLARSVQRGRRSAIGVYGFLEGGLIAERGKLPDESLSPLDCRIDLPAAWRFVLICPRDVEGLWGGEEQDAFGQLPAVPEETTQRMIDEAVTHLLPAAARGDFVAFSDSVFRYGQLAGSCYLSVQGGLYHSPRVEQIVQFVRDQGVAGVGQSSWGPTVFALLPEDGGAFWLSEQIRHELQLQPDEIIIAEPANEGSVVKSEE